MGEVYQLGHSPAAGGGARSAPAAAAHLMALMAVTTLQKLARDIAGARQAEASTATIQALHNRFRGLQAAATEHEQLLGGSIDDTRATMQLVNAQLTSLLLAQAS
jgi:hypothetical protein